MSTMKALVYKGDGQTAIEDKPIPTIQEPTDVVLKMIYTTICGTDLHILGGHVPTCEPGRTLGHEGVGEVYEVGDGVHRFKKGERVLIGCISSCATCTYCRRSMTSHCLKGGWILGHLVDGTQAEYVRIPLADSGLHHIPEGVNEKHLVMFSDILPTGLECGVLNGKVQPGGTVAVVGVGPVGLAAIINAKLYSPSVVVAIDKDKNRLKVAQALGADHIASPDEKSAADIIEAYGDKIGFDTVIEACGIPATFDMCQNLVAPGGTIANVGVHGNELTLHMEKLWGMNISITTRLVDTVTTPKLLKLFANGVIPDEKIKQLITHEFNFKEMDQAYSVFSAAAKHEALKTIVSM